MADIAFECPECKQHLVIDAGYAGQQVQCSTCSRSITVPQVAHIQNKNPATIKTIQMAIVCGTLLIALIIWKFSGNNAVSISTPQPAPSTQPAPVEQKAELSTSEIPKAPIPEVSQATLYTRAILAVMQKYEVLNKELNDSYSSPTYSSHQFCATFA